MGKPTGFMEFGRELLPVRAPHERIQDHSEFHLQVPEERLRTQAARCMDCGIPFCHTGKLLNGMVSGCPLNNLIPEWNHLVYSGLWRAAYLRLQQDEQLPRIHRPRLPGAVRGLLHARSQQRPRYDQSDRSRDRRAGMG